MTRIPGKIRLTMLAAVLWFVSGCASPFPGAKPSFRRSTTPTKLPSQSVSPQASRHAATLPPPSSVSSLPTTSPEVDTDVVRNQSPQGYNSYQEGVNAWGPYAPNTPTSPAYPTVGRPNVGAPPTFTQPGYQRAPAPVAPQQAFPESVIQPTQPTVQQGLGRPFYVSPDGPFDPAIGPLADILVNVQETQTGKFSVGASVNSDAGVTGQVVIDERNFDIRRIPTSFDDFVNGSAFRGAGQGFRIEALPGNDVQRYMVNFTEPYLFNTRVSFNMSAYLFDRNFFDWDEQRLGGRMSLGYRITPDLSLAASIRAEEVTISDPRLGGVAELDAALGSSDLYLSLIHI